MHKEKQIAEAKEIAAAIFGIKPESIRDATFKEPVLAGILKEHTKEIRNNFDKKILDELSKTV